MFVHRLLAMAVEVRSDLAASPLVVVAVMAGIGFFGLLALTGHRVAAAVLGALGVAWMGVNAQVEGPLLFVLTPGHGIVLADLVGLAAVLIAAWRLAPVVLSRLVVRSQ